MSVVSMSLKRPVTTVMVFVSLTLLGLIAALRLPLEYFPDFDAPFLFVQIPYPGSTPEEVERNITRPAEEALATLSRIKSINSQSTANDASIFIEFKWDADVAIKAVEARDRLEAIRKELPSDVQRFNVLKFSSGDQAVLSLRVSSGRDLSNSYELLNRKVKRALERLPGVARVDMAGVEPPEVQIELLADRVSAHGLDLNQLASRIQAANFSVSGGLIEDSGSRFRVQPIGEFHSLDEIRALVLNDAGLRLGDVAQVSLKPKRKDYARHLDLKPAIGIDVFKERGANLVDVGRRALAEVQRIGQDPEMAGIDIFFLQDQAKGVTSSLWELAEAGLIGLVLSIAVLFLFLRNWASTFMVSLAIPISFVITLGIMYFLGYSLNVLSMMGLLLGIGMVVDNAVVAVESIYQQREKYPDDPIRCSVVGVNNVTIAISAGTLCHCVVFLPNIFGEKNFITLNLSHVAIAICVSLLVSWLVAISLIPMISARIPTPKAGLQQGWVTRFRNRYAALVNWTLHHRLQTMLWTGLLVLVSVVPFALTKSEMIQEGQTRDAQLRYELNGLYQLSELDKSISAVERYLLANKEKFEIESVYSYFDERGSANTLLLFTDADVAVRSTDEIKEDIRKGLPNLPIGTVGFGDGPQRPGGQALTISLIGESSTALNELAPEAVRALSKINGIRDARTGVASAETEIQVRVDRDRALRYGFSAQQVAQFIAVAMRGAPMREYRYEGQEIPVWLRFQGSDSTTIDDLRDLKLRAPGGEQVPLLSLVSVSSEPSPVAVSRTNRQTALQVTLSLAPGAVESEVREAIKPVMDAVNLPPGYRWSYGQGFNDSDEALNQMLMNTILALVMIFVVMAAVFESLVYPFGILSTILFSILGIYWLFFLTGTAFDLMAFIGLLILMGVVVNNGIVMVEHINQLQAEGKSRHDALVEGSRDRLRPVIMTMATTILGLLPLCIGTTQIGGDGPPYFPMARAIAGGLVFSTIVTLIVLPTILSLLDDASTAVRTMIRQARGPALVKPESAEPANGPV
ncbi:AcrB/AcrD/AcrF family protein [Ahniella affigens]|uniref:AcrB/AcrD/AcrF family protein n=1 Tax=Ahniella affigens TaxID=2021234 RepID=A0A2P1PS31_9GAMM|nr:efflux RND transporter permease subunit [Ahniella affigens]AVP97644.1 AcrB/AcrD/AcrF family protein [Ahniella affigens]